MIADNNKYHLLFYKEKQNNDLEKKVEITANDRLIYSTHDSSLNMTKPAELNVYEDGVYVVRSDKYGIEVLTDGSRFGF